MKNTAPTENSTELTMIEGFSIRFTDHNNVFVFREKGRDGKPELDWPHLRGSSVLVFEHDMEVPEAVRSRLIRLLQKQRSIRSKFFDEEIDIEASFEFN